MEEVEHPKGMEEKSFTLDVRWTFKDWAGCSSYFNINNIKIRLF